MLTVTSLKEQDYRGRHLTAGETFDVSPVEAAILRRAQKIALPSDRNAVQALHSRALTVEAPATPRRRRQYRRRDLSAEA